MSHPDGLIGQKIHNYVILRHQARGGMADVYLAQNVNLQSNLVLKIMLPSFVENETFVERFQREATAMAQLHHPNIVQVYDTGNTPDGRPFIAMQYVSGGTLESLLMELESQKQVMTVPFALVITRQVAAALQVAHQGGIIHRDLKPSNILLDEQRRPLLTDLGIAYIQNSQRLTRTDTFIGTPHYMSPEQGKGHTLDARSDIYSLGVILFEMLAGQRPFPGDSHWALVHQHIHEPAPHLATARPRVPRTVSQIVARCLMKDPARRYQSAAELVAALDKALAEVGVAGMLSPSGQWQLKSSDQQAVFTNRAGLIRILPPGSRGRPSQTWGILAAVGVLAVILAVVWFLTNSPTSPSATPPATPPSTQIEIVEVVQSVPTLTPGPASSTPAPTANTVTETPSVAPTDPPITPSPFVATATLLPTSTDSPITAGVVSGRITANVFVRHGPGIEYPQAGTLSEGQIVTVIGRDSRSAWYNVESENGNAAWVAADFVEGLAGSELQSVPPAATIPAPPEPTASAPTAPLPISTPSSGGGNPPPPPENSPEPPPTDPPPTDPPPPTAVP